jgi:hypothetical protein
MPDNAENQTIVWSIEDAGDTGADFDVNNDLVFTAIGKLIVRVTIIDGWKIGIPAIYDFEIEVIQPVTGISGIPVNAVVGTPLSLTTQPGFEVLPSYATNRTITNWSIISGQASLTDDVLHPAGSGIVTIRATIADGWAIGKDAFYDFDILVIQAVTNIINVPLNGVVGTLLPLSGTIVPSNASRTAIIWSIENAGNTGADFENNEETILTFTAAGEAEIRATITDGLAIGTNYTQNFTITVIQPVTGITGVPTTAVVGTGLPLSGTVEPSNATNQAITWSIASAGTTRATIIGNTMNTLSAGTAEVRATIINGLGAGVSYVQIFPITVVQPVEFISGVPLAAVVDEPLNLTDGIAVMPLNATFRTITWSIVDTADDTETPISSPHTFDAAGNVTIRARIANGLGMGINFTYDFSIEIIQPVTNITGIPPTGIVGGTHALTEANGIVITPSYATNQGIVWSVIGGAATIAGGNTLNFNAAGTVRVRAVIANGRAVGINYTQDFTIDVIQPVTEITNVPFSAGAGIPLTLSGEVVPSNASNQTIVWSIESAGDTGAAFDDDEENVLTFTDAGAVEIRATIENGLAAGVNYTQDFTITVKRPVTDITGVPPYAVAGTELELTATVVPSGATTTAITWSVIEGPASITGNILNPASGGTVRVQARIADGLYIGADYEKEFTITVIQPVTGVTGVAVNGAVGTALTLGGTVMPLNATFRTVTWSVASGPATIAGATLTFSAAGTVTVRANIENGWGMDEDAHYDFAINVIQPVMGISGVPLNGVVGGTHALTEANGIVITPSYATNQGIIWSVISGPANITGDILNPTGGGIVRIRAVITNGTAVGTNYSQFFDILIIQPVTGIIDVPETAVVGRPLTLSGTVLPVNASNQAIVWSVVDDDDPGSIDADINNILHLYTEGTIKIRATITNGLAINTDFTDVFDIKIIQAVENITNVPDVAVVGVPLTLTGNVEPGIATNKDIVWSMVSGPASITRVSPPDNNDDLPDTFILNLTGGGIVIVRATIADGYAIGTNYTQDFSITVIQPVEEIINVPASGGVGIPLTLGGTVLPSNASRTAIIWSLEDGPGSVSGNILNLSAPGTVTVRATITDGLGINTDFTDVFEIIVIQPVTNITDTQTAAVVGVPLTLTGNVVPGIATNKDIVWNVVSGSANITQVSPPDNNDNLPDTFVLNPTGGGIVVVRATIANGLAIGTNYTQLFNITVIQPVTSIINVPETAVVGTPLTLSGTVLPANASRTAIIWSLEDGPGSVSGNILTLSAEGTVTVRATITNGLGINTDFTDVFNIEVIQPVENIANVPNAAVVGVPLTLTGNVEPGIATNKDIIWSMVSGPANITRESHPYDNDQPDMFVLNPAGGGTVVVRATIANGLAIGTNYTQQFNITVIQPVTDIVNVPETAVVGTPLILSGTVLPTNASRTAIIWSEISGPGSISGNILNLSAEGIVTVRATITDGLAIGTDFTDVFEIRVIQPVTNITNVPNNAVVGIPLTLTGNVVPNIATYKDIAWSVASGPANITRESHPYDNDQPDKFILNPTGGGTVIVRATIANGLAIGTNYTQLFSITVIQPVTDIVDVPETAVVGTPLTLTGTVLPTNASRTAIIWSVVYGPGNVSGNILTLSAAGKVTVRATIIDGWAIGDNAWEEFDIEVIQPVTNITNVPSSAVVGIPLTLTGNVVPGNATNQTIIWDVTSGPGNVSGNILNLTNDGIVIVRATINNGSAIGTNYAQFFSITVVRSVLNIVSNIPSQIYAGTPFTLTGTISPANATNRTIVWSVKNPGTAGATITGNILNTNAGGVVTITATIINGLAIGENYTQDYNLNVLARPIITLRMEDFNLIDQGRGVFDNLDPIILSKGSGDPVTTKPYVEITANAAFTNVFWRLGNIPLGAGNTLMLNALNFNNGNYTLTMSFTNNGIPWLASLPFTVID